MKKISICIPCYNEEGNVYEMYLAVTREMEKLKRDYDYEIIFSDNDSEDHTQMILRDLAQNDKHVKVIINLRNFGPYPSGWNCYFHASGDAVLSIACDFQSPPELIGEYIRLWEEGSLVVCGQKNKAQENKAVFWLRNLYYRIMRMMSDTVQQERLQGLYLMDRSVVSRLKEAYEPGNDPIFLVMELGYKIRAVPYEQQKRKSGRSSYNVAKYFDTAVTALVNSSYVPLRTATILGAVSSLICFLIGVVYLVYKLLCWNSFNAGMAPMLIGMFFIGSIQLLYIGILGEYIGSILRKISKHPLVVEKETINFDRQQEDKDMQEENDEDIYYSGNRN